MWNGEAYKKLKFGAKQKTTDTKKASRAAVSLVEQMKAQGADFSLVMSGPEENRGLTSCKDESVDWFFGSEVINLVSYYQWFDNAAYRSPPTYTSQWM